MEKQIVVYNNHTGIVETLTALLTGEGITMVVAESYHDMHQLLKQRGTYLLIIDVELVGLGWGSGIDMIQDIRRKSSLPIIVVSKQSSESAKIMALEAGADDYVTANCNPLELLARVKSQIRRYTQLTNVSVNIDRIYKIDDLEINDIRREVKVEGRLVKLTPIEYKILRLLMQERGKVLSINQIYERIWHMQAFGADNTIAVHIRHIREKIETNPKEPRYLKVVWGNGYKVG